jgi:hypothetical protein
MLMLLEDCVNYIIRRSQKDRRYMIVTYLWAIIVDAVLIICIYHNTVVTTDLLWCLPILADLVLGAACEVLVILDHKKPERSVLPYRSFLMTIQVIIGFVHFGFGFISILSAISILSLSGIWFYRIYTLDSYIEYIKNLTTVGGI